MCTYVRMYVCYMHATLKVSVYKCGTIYVLGLCDSTIVQYYRQSGQLS